MASQRRRPLAPPRRRAPSRPVLRLAPRGGDPRVPPRRRAVRHARPRPSRALIAVLPEILPATARACRPVGASTRPARPRPTRASTAPLAARAPRGRIPRVLPPRCSHACHTAAARAFFHRATLHARHTAATRVSFHRAAHCVLVGRNPRALPPRRSPRFGRSRFVRSFTTLLYAPRSPRCVAAHRASSRLATGLSAIPLTGFRAPVGIPSRRLLRSVFACPPQPHPRDARSRTDTRGRRTPSPPSPLPQRSCKRGGVTRFVAVSPAPARQASSSMHRREHEITRRPEGDPRGCPPLLQLRCGRGDGGEGGLPPRVAARDRASLGGHSL